MERLLSNGDINFWDDEVRAAAGADPNAQAASVLLDRGSNTAKVLRFNLPSELLRGPNRAHAIRYLTASIYNNIVCDGAKSIVVFMNDKAEEKRLSAAIAEHLEQNFERMHVYGNFGEPVTVANSGDFSLSPTKEISPDLILSPACESDKTFIGVDVGGTAIKTVVMHHGNTVYSFSQDVDRDSGGESLRDQILAEVRRAKNWARAHLEVEIQIMGLTFPSPVKKNADGSFKVVRLTNYERHWAMVRKGNEDFSKDYEAINNIASDLSRLGVAHLAVLNDSDAFGFGEIFARMIADGKRPEQIGTKIVLPIGTGPGFVKIVNGRIEDIPNQGGHMVIDLSGAARDPGCGVAGCYGGYVPASAFSLRAKRFGIDLSGRDGFVPADMGGALAMLSDMAGRVATEAVALCRITGADEVILAGGITSGFTGMTLAKAANEAIAKNYPAFADRVKVTLSRSDINFGGAIGAARYAVAVKNTGEEKNRPNWHLEHSLPEISIGRGNAGAFFDSLRAEGKRACIVMQRELGEYLAARERHLWFVRESAQGNILWLDDFADREAFIEAVRARGADVIVPIGAGTVTDWGKFAGSRLTRPVAAVPSTLSSNAAFTEKAIFYKGEGTERKRESEPANPPRRVIIDVGFLSDLLDFRPSNGIDAARANRAGAGDIVSIYSALRDWDLAVSAGKERPDSVIRRAAEEVFGLVEENAAEIRENSGLGFIVLASAMAQASFLNMRYGTSRPKDGSEHLLADEIDKRMPGIPRLHGEQVAIASLVMGYLFSTSYDPRAFIRIRNLVRALGLPDDPSKIGTAKEAVIDAMRHIHPRHDKYTFFDAAGAGMTEERAEQVYETVFGSLKNEVLEFMFDVCRCVSNSVRAMFEHVSREVVPNLNPEKIHELIMLLLETKERGGRVIINAAGRVGEVAVFFQQKLRALGFIVDDLKEITPEFLGVSVALMKRLDVDSEHLQHIAKEWE